MPRRILVTAALPYSNGRPHVGHVAGAYLPADTFVRYLRAKGDEVLFVCGSDDNGVAVTLSAKKEGLTPQETVIKYNAAQKLAFDGLGIEFDVYGGTHMPEFVERHNALSQEFFRTLYDKGLFTKRTTQQLYDATALQFLPDRYVTGVCHHCGYDRANGDQCENCGKEIDPLLLKNPVSVLTGTTPEVRPTTHWYLRLAEVEGPLRAWLESKTDWRPTVRNFALGQIEQGLPERAMTRDITWGVPVPAVDPDAKDKVLYVWFDAPIGYVSFTAQLLENRGGKPEDYARWWKDPETRIFHFIGEDNIIFHALIWPAMLMAEGSYTLPTQVVANSFLNIRFPGKDEEEKISKSRGTAIWIEEFLKENDPDPLRYYLTAIAPESARTAYEPDDFILRNDGELLAVLGNFINRVVTFAVKNYGGRVPTAGPRDDDDLKALAARTEQADKVSAELEQFHFRAALTEAMNLARAGNQYLDLKKPWVQRKTDETAAGRTINVCLQLARALAVVTGPFLPHLARKTLAMLNLGEDSLTWNRVAEELPDGHPLGEPVMLVRKLKDEKKPA
jgi:methionyl-tRNA synthetase